MNHKKNDSTNLLKKIEVGNPLFNLGLDSLLKKHDATTNDNELINFYHHLLDCVEGSSVAESMTYNMIAFSTDMDVNPVFLEMETMIMKHNNSINQ
ncbi:hypothetical protein [Winogradskyella forsetii]|uniref:hypothetical protein n=1 Tax=Winogradskyella forsetii TaxID=2686077 RepID=UPI0015BC90DF|nr:hypothetical protein [Winogradskyella forsetii]